MPFLFLFAGTSIADTHVQPNEILSSFPGLKPLHMKNEDVTLYYAPEISQKLNGKHPEEEQFDKAGLYISRPLRTQLLGPEYGYFTIDCDSGPSWDPGCTFSQEVKNGTLKEIIHIYGLRFALPGNGNIYVEGHNDTMFNIRKKFTWREGSFEEVKQPYKYVGLTTTTRDSIQIFSSQEYNQTVASLPKGAALTVLVNDGDNYLIKTTFGLLGWVKIPESSQEDSPISGIYWNGD